MIKKIPSELQKRANQIARRAGYHHANYMDDVLDHVHHEPYCMRTLSGRFFPGITFLKWNPMTRRGRYAWYEPSCTIVPESWLYDR